MPALLLAALSLLTAAPLGHADKPAVFRRADWIGACDNTLRCTAIGLAADGGDQAYISITRNGDAQAEPELKIVLYSEVNIPSGPLRASAEGLDVQLAGRWSDDEIIASSADVGLAAALARLDAAGTHALSLSIGRSGASVSLAGAEAALAWIDERQGRDGTSTALVRRGPKPAASLPPPPEEPVYARPPEGTAVEIRPAKVPDALWRRAELKSCDRSALARTEARAAWRIGPNEVLWSVPCAATPFNLQSLFFLSDPRGEDIRPAPIPVVPLTFAGEAAPPTEPYDLANADFDPGALTLNAFEKGRGAGDCGVLERFVWDGRRFQPLEVDYMPACRGVTPEAWPALFRGRAK